MPDDNEDLERMVEDAVMRIRLRARTVRVSRDPSSWPVPSDEGDEIQPPAFVLLSAEAMRFQLLLVEQGYEAAMLIPEEPWTGGVESFFPIAYAVEFIRPTKRVVLYTEHGWHELEAFQLWMQGVSPRWAWTANQTQQERDRLWAWLNR